MVSTGYQTRGSGAGGLGPLRELLASMPAAVAYVAGPARRGVAERIAAVLTVVLD